MKEERGEVRKTTKNIGAKVKEYGDRCGYCDRRLTEYNYQRPSQQSARSDPRRFG